MNKLELLIAAVLLAIMAKASWAGNPNPARIEPEPVRPVCLNLLGLPCHEPGRPTTMDGSQQPKTPAKPKPQPKPCASNDWTFGAYARNGGKKCG